MKGSSQGKSTGAGDGVGVGVHGAGNARSLLSCYTRTKARPSKWDDAQKWLSRAAPDDDGRRRSSSADDRLLLPSASQKGGRRSWSSAVEDAMGDAALDEGEEDEDAGETTKRVDAASVVQERERERHRRVSLRDVGTEMTPGGSKEPSRANTPRAALPAAGAARTRASPGRRGGGEAGLLDPGRGVADDVLAEEAAGGSRASAVSPATVWDEAERAKHMARYRREEMKIQAWENRERRKAELQMKMTEVKAERMRVRAQEKAAGKLAAARALAEERRAGAEAMLSRRVARATDKGGVLRRSRSGGGGGGHLLSLKLPLLCS